MLKFEVGQKVRIADNRAARGWALSDFIGKEFTVEAFANEEGTGVDVQLDPEDSFLWHVPASACELVTPAPAVSESFGADLVDLELRVAAYYSAAIKTPFERVSEMNEAFGNPKGDPENIDWNRVRSQYKNIFDEYCEGLVALGYNKTDVEWLKGIHKTVVLYCPMHEPNVIEVRDALADQQVFKDGTLHMMGYNGDNDMHDVVDGVMTRFIKDEADEAATIALHASKGVTDVYFEGEYPKRVMKSASDQPDAPKGKFLKSASYKNTVFRPAP